MSGLTVEYQGRVDGNKLYKVTEPTAEIIVVVNRADKYYCNLCQAQACAHTSAVISHRSQDAGATHCNEG